MNQLRIFSTLALAAAVSVSACKSLGTPEDQQEAGGLWKSLSGHDKWAQFDGHEGFQRSKGPHGKFVRTFLNSVGAASPAAPGYGTIIVKENFGKEDLESLESLTVMQRVEGYDAENNDWFWARYTPAGEQTHSGKVSMCSDCHFDAEGDDFIFLND